MRQLPEVEAMMIDLDRIINELIDLGDALMMFHDAWAEEMPVAASERLRAIIHQPTDTCALCSHTVYKVDERGRCAQCAHSAIGKAPLKVGDVWAMNRT